ncbi:MAG: hypothetical protein JW940_02490 [Polyangiaceae bacterium]|nr:hypothetical protein [Polyangiaceae bacterium]
MSNLTPKAQELVLATRDALRPSAADRERVAQTLAPLLGTAVAGASALSTTSAAAKATVVKILAGLVGFGVVGGALVLALRSEAPPAATPAAAPVEPLLSVSTKPAPVASTKPPPAAPTAETPAAEAPRTSTPTVQRTRSANEPHDASPPTDSLPQEVSILSRASSALHSGRPAAALTALAEHQRKFPRGALAEERTAARIQALCALGRTTEAQAELARLARVSPNSPLEAHARKACGLASTKKKE